PTNSRDAIFRCAGEKTSHKATDSGAYLLSTSSENCGIANLYRIARYSKMGKASQLTSRGFCRPGDHKATDFREVQKSIPSSGRSHMGEGNAYNAEVHASGSLNASTKLVPVMNADDLRKGLAKVAG